MALHLAAWLEPGLSRAIRGWTTWARSLGKPKYRQWGMTPLRTGIARRALPYATGFTNTVSAQFSITAVGLLLVFPPPTGPGTGSVRASTKTWYTPAWTPSNDHITVPLSCVRGLLVNPHSNGVPTTRFPASSLTMKLRRSSVSVCRPDHSDEK